MLPSSYHIIGLMSGTSLDGLDICDVSFKKHKGNWEFIIHHAETISYSVELENSLLEAFHWSKEKVDELDVVYSAYLADQVVDFIERHNITSVDAVSSHGHTIWHQPNLGFTKQIGNLPLTAERSKLTWVCDFRTADVALAGQGAPLIPIGDELLFKDYDFCLNLGGFANLSFSDNNGRLAYDICAVNVVLNKLAQSLNLTFDRDGDIAKRGRSDADFLSQLSGLAYYRRNFPKSLGMEWVESSLWPLIESSELSFEDKLASYTEHIAYQIGSAMPHNKKKIFVTGGGAKNKFLLESISRFTNNFIHIPEVELVDFKEAVVFAFLGVLRLRNEVNCLKSVTGAKMDHCSGNIFFKP